MAMARSALARLCRRNFYSSRSPAAASTGGGGRGLGILEALRRRSPTAAQPLRMRSFIHEGFRHFSTAGSMWAKDVPRAGLQWYGHTPYYVMCTIGILSVPCTISFYWNIYNNYCRTEEAKGRPRVDFAKEDNKTDLRTAPYNKTQRSSSELESMLAALILTLLIFFLCAVLGSEEGKEKRKRKIVECA